MAKSKSRDSHYDVTFCVKGVNTSTAFGQQPAGTTPVGVNVRAFDYLDRQRGGSRPGISKFISTRPNGANAIQLLDYTMDTTIATPTNTQKMNANRTPFLFAVAGGTAYNGRNGAWTAASLAIAPNAPTLSSTVRVMRSAYNSLVLFIVDGENYNYWVPSTNTLTKWTATAGTLPLDTNSKPARLICTWRARTVLAGLPADPNNWFMSAVYQGEGVGGGIDWDYAPATTTVTQAVSGNNAPAGLCSDIVTALVPYSDDILIMGGDHTIFAMNGDPMNGGRIDLVSDRVGFAWGDAWCKDAFGTIYFMSNTGSVYTLVPGQKPVKLSSAIDNHMMRLSMDSINVRLQWDENLQGCHVYTTELAAAASCTHYFWERRTGGWWMDEFANTNHNPLTCVNFDGNSPDDRVSLIGGWDGYVRGWNLADGDDDGSDIESSVVLGPMLTAGFDELIAKDMQAVLGVDSGDVNFAVHVGATAEAALASTAVVTGTWSAARNLTSPVRRAGHAIYIKLTSSSQWSMEGIRVLLAGTGKVRKRGV